MLYSIELRVENQYSVRMFNGDDGFGPPVENRTSEGGERVMPLLVNCQSKLASFPACPPTSQEVKQEGILVDFVAWVYTLSGFELVLLCGLLARILLLRHCCRPAKS